MSKRAALQFSPLFQEGAVSAASGGVQKGSKQDAIPKFKLDKPLIIDMNRISIIFLLLIMGGGTFVTGQNITRNKVVLEIFTGTWCVYCPGSALGADDLIANGHDIAIIENHIGDSYEIPAAASRDNYYSVAGYPTQVFDGTDQYSGGNATTSIYGSSYLPSYNNAKPVLTPIDIGLTWDYDFVTGTFNVMAIAHQVGTVSTANLVMHLAITESHIPASWFGLTELNFLNRSMLPNGSGTALTLSLGMRDTIQYSFTLNPAWVRNNCEIVAFIQDPATKVVYNGAVESLEGPKFNTDVKLQGFLDEFSATQCEDASLEPEIIIENRGASVLTSVDILFSVNNGSPLVYNWTGALSFREKDTVSLAGLSYTPLASGNALQIFLANPNGMLDDDASNNIVNVSFDVASHLNGIYQLVIRPDGRGSEITWNLTHENTGAVIKSGGPYPNNSTSLIISQFVVGTELGCYRFEMHDSGGDGLTADGSSYFRFFDGTGSVVLESLDGDFGEALTANFSVAFNTAVDPLLAEQIQVYPNPSEGWFSITLPELAGQSVDLSVYHLNGQLISQAQTLTGTYDWDLRDLTPGIYLLKAQQGARVYTTKLSIR